MTHIPETVHFSRMRQFILPSMQEPLGLLQRKKSLPDVADLVGVAAQQSSQEMTREEISVLSSARRDNVRRQMEEIERYKSNPLMYILNPRVQVSQDILIKN